MQKLLQKKMLREEFCKHFGQDGIEKIKGVQNQLPIFQQGGTPSPSEGMHGRHELEKHADHKIQT